jgi:hypothetical protein
LPIATAPPAPALLAPPPALDAPPVPPGASSAPLAVSSGASGSRESIAHAPTPTSAASLAALLHPGERRLQHRTIGGESIAAREALHQRSSIEPWLR